MITVMYNGNTNLPRERNHRTRKGTHQLTKGFSSIDDAVLFWLECEFYSGAITSLDKIIPAGYTHPLLDCMEDDLLTEENVLLNNQLHLYEVENEEWI